MRTTQAVTSCPQCTRYLLDAALRANGAAKATWSTIRQFHQQQAAISQRKQFSTSTPRYRSTSVAQRWTPKGPSKPSIKVMVAQAQQKGMREGQALPPGIGLLPGTFIRPSDKSILYTRKIAKYWLKTRMSDITQVLYAWWGYRSHKISLDRFKVASIASDLHKRMSMALAAADIDKERSILSDGLFNRLKSRIAAGDPSQVLEWKIVRNVRKPKLMSFKTLVVPTGSSDGNKIAPGVIQAVVRIHTVQSVQRMQKQMQSGRKRASEMALIPLDPQPTEKESIEYLVLNKSIQNGKAEPWTIWGFTKETSLEDIAKTEQLLSPTSRSKDKSPESSLSSN